MVGGNLPCTQWYPEMEGWLGGSNMMDGECGGAALRWNVGVQSSSSCESQIGVYPCKGGNTNPMPLEMITSILIDL